ncbi:hypothetical protein TeGR_g9560 [Tetraparma gracilis]|uniref:MPN domain-containing protein n=1 Tax=Tetraparma gracilis TaxID=2962635 RepID=A0ABQ6MYU9_9STRA|nr:hypothetical protein TeGR_g9560 [Tetraparma gracilis]
MSMLSLSSPSTPSSSPSSVLLHPLALSSILEAFVSRPPSSARVLGCLLGRVATAPGGGRVVEVVSAYAVPSAEQGASVAIGKDYQRQMAALAGRTSGAAPVGWFATSPGGLDGACPVPESASLVHDFFAGECADEPVHLIVDTSLQGDATSARAYTATPLAVQGVALANMFTEVRVEARADEGERIFVDQCVQGNAGAGQSERRREDELLASLDGLLELLGGASGYVDKVVAGSEPADPSRGRAIADALAAVPTLQPGALKDMLSGSLQDLLMVMYLGKLTKTQLAIAEKLTATVAI